MHVRSLAARGRLMTNCFIPFQIIEGVWNNVENVVS